LNGASAKERAFYNACNFNSQALTVYMPRGVHTAQQQEISK